MIRYTILRFLIFFGCLCVLWLVGLREQRELPWLVVGAALLSMVISGIVLRPFRDDVVRKIQAKQEAKAAARKDDRTTDENVEDAATDTGAGKGTSGDPADATADDYR